MKRRGRAVTAVAACVALAAFAGAARLAAQEPGAGPAPGPEDHLPVPIRIVDLRLPDSVLARCRPGVTRLRVRIDQRGLVSAAEVARGFPDTLCADTALARRIDVLATRLAREWAFVPAVTGGVPQSIVVEMPVYVPPDTVRVPWHGGTILGRVVDAASGTPLPITTVALDGTALTTRTDRRGTFRFDHMVHVRVAVIATRKGYQPDTAMTETVPGRVDTLLLRLRPHPPARADSGGVAK